MKRSKEVVKESSNKQRKLESVTAPASSTGVTSSSTTGSTAADGVEKLLTPVDKPGVVRVLDRRINTYCFDDKSSLYSLLRAWVQDDPDKSPVESQPMTPTSQNNFKLTKTEYDELISYLEFKLKEQRSIDSEFAVGSLSGISPSDILSLHTIYFKKIKRIWKMLFTAKYGRYCQQDTSQIIPRIAHIEKRLTPNQEGFNEEFNVHQLNQELQKRKEIEFPSRVDHSDLLLVNSQNKS